MNSKIIGNQYEREFSKKLSLWVSSGKRDDIFWRDLSSGARTSVRKKEGKSTSYSGDIVAVDLEYKEFTDTFYIDTKCYKEWNSFFINPKNKKSNTILNQWIKTYIEAKEVNKLPIMPCYIRNRITDPFIIIPDLAGVNNINCIYCEVLKGGVIYRFSIVMEDEFFKVNDWKEFLNIGKNILN